MVGSPLARFVALAALLAVFALFAASARADSLVRAAAVQKAFKSQGITLVDNSYGMASSISVLTSTKPHDGWSVAAYVYPSVGGAAASYKGNIASWHKSGMAGALVRNVVIAVVPKGARIGKKAKAFALPAAVARAVAAFKG